MTTSLCLLGMTFILWSSRHLSLKQNLLVLIKKWWPFLFSKKEKNEEKLFSVINLKRYFYKGMEHAEVEKYIGICFEIFSWNKLGEKYLYSALFWSKCRETRTRITPNRDTS